MMERNSSIWSYPFATFVVVWSVVLFSNILLLGLAGEEEQYFPHLVPRESRRTVASSEFGTITAVDVKDMQKGPYHLQFITLDTGSLFLPVLLHADMVFYVHTGRGIVTWVSEDKSNSIEVERGDIYRIEEGNVFYVQSHSNATREKLRIHAIFNTITDESPLEGFVGPYSNISDLVRGFSDKVLQMGFRVSEDVIKGIKWVERPPQIVQFQPKNETDEESNWKEGIFEALVGRKYSISLDKGKKKSKTKTFNLYNRKPDVENCNGWSIAVTNRDFKPLRDSDIGVFMVNLTRGAMMGPHWNPMATEIAIVVHGEGMVQFVCASSTPSGEMSEQFKCQNETFKVREGDVFMVPRFHAMVQIAFNNDSFVFVGFTTSASRNHPQYLAGKLSVLRVVDREVLARAFNTANTTSTLDRFLDSQEESIILECTSCAEELERKIEEEIDRRREEEARRREEEEAMRREEEEEKEARKREEAKKREEEETGRRRKEEEKEARKREEEAARRKKEEKEARKREEEKEAARRKEEEEEEEEEEAAAARRRQEEATKREEEKEARRREEEEETRRREEAREREEEEDARRREQEEEEEEAAAAAGRREEEEARRTKAETAARMEQQRKVTEGEEEEAPEPAPARTDSKAGFRRAAS